MKNIFAILLLIPSVYINAQFQKTIRLNADRFKSTSEERIPVNPDFSFTSVSLSVEPGNSFEGARLITDADTFLLHADAHQNDDTVLFSRLVIFPEIQNEILFYRGNLQGEIKFHFLNAHAETAVSPKRHEKKNAACLGAPESISRDEWRAGLPVPDYERIEHRVENLIVHHSAGSNTDTNYTNVIRNIYLYHTQSRLWSDIGYNYVIAQNGQLYDARDPGNFEQDNVQGAHFCGSNHGTMGVCVLGNYETAQPADTVLTTLSKLFAWKAAKDSINAYSVFNHPLNVSLDYISGHRDGCATDCPGENLYLSLERTRYAADSLHTACNVHFDRHVGIKANNNDTPQILIDYDAKYFRLKSPEQILILKVITASGRLLLQTINTGQSIDFSIWSPGVYIIITETNNDRKTDKLLVR